jgi:NADH-quinone oxidoreductase subunit G
MDYAPFANSFKVYIGHHGDRGAAAADVVLPAPPIARSTAST